HSPKSAGGRARARPGDVIAYTLTYGNAGVSDATGVVLTEFLPANTTADPSNLANGWVDAGGGRFTFAVGTLAAGTVNQVKPFKVRVNAPVPVGTGAISTTAQIADDGSSTDTTPANNPARDTTPVNTPPVGQPDAFVTGMDQNLIVHLHRSRRRHRRSLHPGTSQGRRLPA